MRHAIVDFLQRIAECIASVIVAIAVWIMSDPQLLEGTKEERRDEPQEPRGQ
jgi:hypothetical protein